MSRAIFEEALAKLEAEKNAKVDEGMLAVRPQIVEKFNEIEKKKADAIAYENERHAQAIANLEKNIEEEREKVACVFKEQVEKEVENEFKFAIQINCIKQFLD